MNLPQLSETQRGWLYVGALLIGVAAVIFGVTAWEDVQTTITGLVLVLTGGLATKNTLLKNRPNVGTDDGLTTVGLVVVGLAIVALVILILLAFDVVKVKG